jgi:hypothetical protein
VSCSAALTTVDFEPAGLGAAAFGFAVRGFAVRGFAVRGFAVRGFVVRDCAERVDPWEPPDERFGAGNALPPVE